MQSWITPFIFVAVILAIYLFSPQERRPALQDRIRKDFVFLAVAAMVIIVFANISTIYPFVTWLKWLTRLVLAITLVVALRRIFAKNDDSPASE